jgi:hypothetical protein
VNETFAYGFAGVFIIRHVSDFWCCACWELSWPTGKLKGKKMVVQAHNAGFNDPDHNRFILAVSVSPPPAIRPSHRRFPFKPLFTPDSRPLGFALTNVASDPWWQHKFRWSLCKSVGCGQFRLRAGERGRGHEGGLRQLASAAACRLLLPFRLVYG